MNSCNLKVFLLCSSIGLSAGAAGGELRLESQAMGGAGGVRLGQQGFLAPTVDAASGLSGSVLAYHKAIRPLPKVACPPAGLSGAVLEYYDKVVVPHGELISFLQGSGPAPAGYETSLVESILNSRRPQLHLFPYNLSRLCQSRLSLKECSEINFSLKGDTNLALTHLTLAAELLGIEKYDDKMNIVEKLLTLGIEKDQLEAIKELLSPRCLTVQFIYYGAIFENIRNLKNGTIFKGDLMERIRMLGMNHDMVVENCYIRAYYALKSLRQ